MNTTFTKYSVIVVSDKEEYKFDTNYVELTEMFLAEFIFVQNKRIKVNSIEVLRNEEVVYFHGEEE